MMAGRAQIPAWTPAELGAPDLTPRRRLRRLRVEQREARVEMIKADSGAEAGRILADRLREAKLI
jgi:electron transfer flavoprotein alpha/beta subunit